MGQMFKVMAFTRDLERELVGFGLRDEAYYL